MLRRIWTIRRCLFTVFTLILFVSISVRGDDAEKSDIYVMEPIEVKAKRLRDVIAEPLSESAGLELSTTVIDQAEIERQGAKTAIDALEYVPGAWVETRGRKVKQFFSIRGQKYPYPEYAIDGAWQREFHETPYFFSAANIERIEVIRSSAALLTGLSGLAGIVNIVPREYKEPGTAGVIEYGSFDSYRSHLSHGATAGAVSYAISAGSEHTDGPEDKNAAEGISNFLGSAGWRPLESLSIKANLFHLYGKRELRRAEPPAPARLQETSERFDPVRTTLGNIKAHFRPGGKASTTLLLHYIDRDHNFVSAPEDPHKSTHERDYEWGANFIQSLAPTDGNTLRIGGYYNHWIAPNGKRFYVGKRCDLETLSAVAVDEHRFGSLGVDAGLRWAKTYMNDYGAFNVNGSSKGLQDVTTVKDEWEPSIFNGSIGAAYYLSEAMSLHLNLASGYIPPRTGTLDIVLQEPENERRVKLDLGVRMIRGGFGQASLVGFFTQQKDAIVLSGRTEEIDGRIMELYMNRDQDQLGVEFEARTATLLNIVESFLNVMAMRSRAKSDDEMESNEEMPDLIISGGVYASRTGFDLSILWKYMSPYESSRFSAEGSQPLGDFHSINASVGWSFGKKHRARVYVEIKNLTDEEFSTVVGYPDLGRRFVIGVRQSLR